MPRAAAIRNLVPEFDQRPPQWCAGAHASIATTHGSQFGEERDEPAAHAAYALQQIAPVASTA